MAITACRNATQEPSSQPAASVGAVEVALLHPGRENDGGWNELACRALQKLHDRSGVTVRHTFAPNKSTFKSEMRDYARAGCKLVICHGSEYVKAAREVAPDFPNTKFVVTGSADAGQGVATLDFRLWEATYLCGVVAAYLAPDGPAGLIGGQDFVTVRQTLDAFANGARSVRPDYASYTQYVGSWEDVAKAQQTARSLIETRGVKVIFQNTDAAASGVFQAAQAAGIIAFGANGNQNDLAPAVVAASAIIQMEKAFEMVLAAVRRSDFRDEAIVCDIQSGVVDVVLNPAFGTRLGPEGLLAFRRARESVATGQVHVLARGP